MRPAHLHRPADVDVVRRGAGQLAQWRDVDRPGRPQGFCPWFVGGNRIGQRAEFAIDLDTDGRGEVVVLLAAGFQEREPHLDLGSVLQPGVHFSLRTRDGGGLTRLQDEGELLLLESGAARGLEGAWLQQSFFQPVERQLFQAHIRVGRIRQVVTRRLGCRGGSWQDGDVDWIGVSWGWSRGRGGGRRGGVAGRGGA